MATFWSLLQRSIIVQSLLTLGLVTTACILWGSGRSVPADMQQLLTIVVAFWMGTKAQHVVEAAGKSREA